MRPTKVNSNNGFQLFLDVLLNFARIELAIKIDFFRPVEVVHARASFFQ